MSLQEDMLINLVGEHNHFRKFRSNTGVWNMWVWLYLVDLVHAYYKLAKNTEKEEQY